MWLEDGVDGDYNDLRWIPSQGEIFDNGGWHFNNIFSAEEISLKLKTFAHTEFMNSKYSSISVIREKIEKTTKIQGKNHKGIPQSIYSLPP